MPTHPHQHILKRTVRFTINSDGSTLGNNTTAGKPSMTTLGRYYELQIAVQGAPDQSTGYLIGIQEIDALVRNTLLPVITAQINDNPSISPSLLLPKLWSTTTEHLKPTLHAIHWQLTPYHSIEMNNQTHDSNAVLLRQTFEFAAAHRLHSPSMSDQENADFFGKCSNPAGHGHNYKVEPTIRIPISAHTPQLQLQIEQAVNDTIIDPLDHKFLNTDCPPFDQSADGTIPSVEHITTHCYHQLAPALESLGCTLDQITVWETDRTSATYPA
ncbi:MAG: 6-carboxytetrahydropterin synthase [Phycisphaerales bacterium]|nr:6-carboxytetrahydropterin synthase [Phycisphaerales bacterium]